MRATALITALTSLWLAQSTPRSVFVGTPAEVIRLDVQVISSAGDPIPGLGAADFDVRIADSPRQVVSADFVRFSSEATRAEGPVRTPGRLSRDSRVFVIAVDEPAFTPRDVQTLRGPLQRFLSRVRREDVLGLYPFSLTPVPLRLTHEHRALAIPLMRLAGSRDPFPGQFQLSPSEIAGVTAQDEEVMRDVMQRVCGSETQACRAAVHAEAHAVATMLEGEADQRIGVMEELVRGLGQLPARKNVILISGGLQSTTRTGGRPNVSTRAQRFRDLVAASEVTVYAMYWAMTPAGAAGQRDRLAADRDALGQGLDLLAGGAQGALFRIEEAASSDRILDRILRETSAQYVLGVLPAPADRNGQARSIRVRVHGRKVIVRSRTEVTLAAR